MLADIVSQSQRALTSIGRFAPVSHMENRIGASGTQSEYAAIPEILDVPA
jgi:hypothetical protein